MMWLWPILSTIPSIPCRIRSPRNLFLGKLYHEWDLKPKPLKFYKAGAMIVQLWCSVYVIWHYYVHRYLGLTFLMKTNGIDPRMQDFVSAEWASFLNPVALLWLYCILGIKFYFCVSRSCYDWFSIHRNKENPSTNVFGFKLLEVNLLLQGIVIEI
jgi:hypothetical protein